MPISPQARDLAIRTLLGEADQSPEGYAAVANVMKNRALSGVWGDPYNGGLTNTIKARRQFSVWNQDDPKLLALAARVNAIPTTDANYQRAGQVVDGVFNGQIGDNTNGATHYYAPSGMRGGQPPDWAVNQQGRRIGTQFFYRLPLTSANTAGTGVTSPSMVGSASAASAAPAAPLDSLGNAKPAAQQAVSVALADAKSMLGKNEVPNRTEIMQYLHDGGQDLDPHKVAWCAAFVSASLQKAGLPVPTQVVQGSAFGPGAYAPNYKAYGTAVAPQDIQAGDILVSNDGSHVGFAEGPIRQGPNGPEVQLLAGNEKDASGQYAPGSYTSPTGAVANRSQVGMVGERWVPLSQYSARRYVPADNQSASAAPAAATAPTPTTPPLYMGDSRGVGMSMSGPKGETTAVEGQGPDKVLDQILNYKGGFAGRDIYLSPGTANLMANGQWDQATFDHSGMANINAQLAALKAGGADMSRVHVLGVPNGFGGDYANAQVKAVADKYGAQTHVLASQDLHPGADGYREIFANAAPEADKAAPQAQPVVAVAPPGSAPTPGTGQNPPAGSPGAPDPNARFQVLWTMGQGGRPDLPYTALNLAPGAGSTPPAAPAPAAPAPAAPAPAPAAPTTPAPVASAPTLTPTSASGPIGASASTAPIGSPLSSILPTFGSSQPNDASISGPKFMPGGGARFPTTTPGAPSMGYPALGADTDQPSAPMASMPPPLFASAQNLLKLLFPTAAG